MKNEFNQGIKRRKFLSQLSTGVALASAPMSFPNSVGKSRRKPNIIVILADDLGYAGLGVQGCSDIPTPHIDSIAKNGVRFTDGYVTCPVCSPSRAGLMTGRYQQRFGYEFNPSSAESAAPDFGLDPKELTLAERLKKMGYVSGVFGKWHLGYRPEVMPTKRGFDEFFGFLGASHSYTNSRGEVHNPILRGTEPVEEKEYLTDALSREAVAFVEKHQNRPFFLYLPFNAVHVPMDTVEKYRFRFNHISDVNRQTHAAMVSAMDDAVGHVLTRIRDLKLEENTLIFFLSDNGGPTLQTTASNLPLSGYKGKVLEGGIRIPFLVQWLGRVPAGQVYTNPVISLDIYATAMVAAGTVIKQEWNLDGVDLMPYLTGRITGVPHEQLYWRSGSQWAIRKGDWKLRHEGNSATLYNLHDDIGEHQDLALQQPDKFNELQADYNAWDSQMLKPRWPSPWLLEQQNKLK